MNQTNWLSLMSNMGFNANCDTYEELKKRYQEKHRKYHTVAHIESVLLELNNSRHIAENECAVELALWFHDAIYNPFSRTNERDSADLAVAFISKNGGSKALEETVRALILATEHHSSLTLNDQKLIVDIDLSILGSSESEYAKFGAAIRNEYKYVPWFLFRKKRVELLEYFLDRASIFSHQYYIDVLEQRARLNIQHEIDSLKST